MLRLIGSLLTMMWLLMAISTVAQTTWPAVLDADGRPLRSGVEYYVLPAATDVAGGLKGINRTNNICPLYVGQEPLSTVVSRGTSVIFTPRVSDTIIRETRDFTAAFSGATICVTSNQWSVAEENPQTRRRYIVTGAQGSGQASTLRYFNIVKNDQGLYTIEWCPNCLTTNCPRPRCGSAGIVVENGKRFVVLDGPAFPFIFRRA